MSVPAAWSVGWLRLNASSLRRQIHRGLRPQHSHHNGAGGHAAHVSMSPNAPIPEPLPPAHLVIQPQVQAPLQPPPQ